MTHYYSTDILPDGGAEFRSREMNGEDIPVAIGYYSNRTGILTFANHGGADDTHEGREARWVLLCVAYLFLHRPIMEGIASLFG